MDRTGVNCRGQEFNGVRGKTTGCVRKFNGSKTWLRGVVFVLRDPFFSIIQHFIIHRWSLSIILSLLGGVAVRSSLIRWLQHLLLEHLEPF